MTEKNSPIIKPGIDTTDAKRSIGELRDQITGPLRNAVRSTVGELERAFVNFARTGELNIRDMVNAIIADLSRIAFNSFVERPLTNLLQGFANGLANFAFGGGGGVPLPPKGFALGGSVSFGRPYVVGEQGRELFVPETSGRIIPSNAMGGGTVIFNVQAQDADSFRRSESQIAAMLNRVAMRGQRNL